MISNVHTERAERARAIGLWGATAGGDGLRSSGIRSRVDVASMGGDVGDDMRPHSTLSDLVRLVSDNGSDDRVGENSDGPRDEFEVGEAIEAEVVRLVRHPREEVGRLKEVAADGEDGSTPFIEIALVAGGIIPFVLIVVGVVLLVYFKA